MKILMVCLGNICRSPLAEGILKSKVNSNSIFVDSAGTAAHHVGELPDKRSVLVAQKHRIDITNQRARKFTEQDLIDFDLIFAMDNSNYDNILSLAKNEQNKRKVKMILNEVTPNLNKNVPDPYYGGDEGFDDVYNMLNEACDVIVSKL